MFWKGASATAAAAAASLTWPSVCVCLIRQVAARPMMMPHLSDTERGRERERGRRGKLLEWKTAWKLEGGWKKAGLRCACAACVFHLGKCRELAPKLRDCIG